MTADDYRQKLLSNISNIDDSPCHNPADRKRQNTFVRQSKDLYITLRIVRFLEFFILSYTKKKENCLPA
jgi:hypothetical protein